MKQSESQISVAVRMPSSQYHHYHFIAGRSNFIRNNHQNPGLNATLSLNAHAAQSFSFLFFHFPLFFVISQSGRTHIAGKETNEYRTFILMYVNECVQFSSSCKMSNFEMMERKPKN